MMPQPEGKRQMGEHTPPLHDVGAGKRSRKPWVILAVAVAIVAALLGSGIWSRVKAGATLRAETAQGGSCRGVGGLAETDHTHRRNHLAWKRAAIHHFPHLRPHEWLSEKVVFRYWRAR